MTRTALLYLLGLCVLLPGQLVEGQTKDFLLPAAYPGECIVGSSVQPGLTTVAACQDSCRRSTDCSGFDFYLNDNSCFFHTDQTVCNAFFRFPLCTHYRYKGCSSTIPTTGGNANGATCVLPFQFRNQVFTNCTMFNYTVPWCSVTANYDIGRRFGVCDFTRMVTTTTTTMTPSTTTLSTTTTTTTTTVPPSTIRSSTTTTTPFTTTTLSSTTAPTTTTVGAPAGCQYTFDVFPGKFAYFGVEQDSSLNTEELCKQQCLRLNSPLNCYGLDFNNNNRKCYFFYDSVTLNQVLNGEETNHLVKRLQCSSTSPTPTTTTLLSECIDTFEPFVSFLVLGGIAVPSANTSEMCQQFCLMTPNCTAVDFDEDNPDAKCFWHSAPVGEMVLQPPLNPSTDVTHYRRINCSAPTTPTQSTMRTVVTMKLCLDTFELSEGMGAYGGTPAPRALTVQLCQQFCRNTTRCVALDFAAINRNVKCFLHLSREVMENNMYTATGVNFYRRIPCRLNVTSPSPLVNGTTTSSPGECVDNFTSQVGVYSEGGSGAPAQYNTVALCRTYCLSLDRMQCSGFDFLAPNCTIHTPQSLSQIGQKPGSTQYTRINCEQNIVTTRPGGCVDRFDVTENFHRFDGIMIMDVDVQFACQQACLMNDSCRTYDFNRLDSECFLFFTPDGPNSLFPREGIYHYARVQCGTTTTVSTTPAAMATNATTTTSSGVCRERYELSVNTASVGGIPLPGIDSRELCQAACSNQLVSTGWITRDTQAILSIITDNTSCVGFDFVTVMTQGPVCYVHTSQTNFNLKITGPPAQGTNQYRRILCTTTTTMPPTSTTATPVNTTMAAMTTTMAPDPCSSDPCQNDGECMKRSDTEFRCSCRGGFHGDTCQDPCPAVPNFPWGNNFWVDCVKYSVLLSSDLDMNDQEETESTCQQYNGTLASIDTIDELMNVVKVIEDLEYDFGEADEMWVKGRTNQPEEIENPSVQVGRQGDRCVILTNWDSDSFRLYSQECDKKVPKYRMCQKQPCPELEDPENGDVDVDSVLPGSEATFTCDDWYELDGDMKATCNPDGAWSEDPPVCKRATGECPNGDPLEGYYCGPGDGRRDCPNNYFCNARQNEFAVCCLMVTTTPPTTTTTTASTTTPTTTMSTTTTTSSTTTPTTTTLSTTPTTTTPTTTTSTTTTTTTPPTSTTTELCIEAWTRLENQRIVGGLPDTTPRLSAEQCQQRCLSYIPRCYAINYRPDAVGVSCFLVIVEGDVDRIGQEEGTDVYRRVTLCGDEITATTTTTTPSVCVGFYDTFERQTVSGGSPVNSVTSLAQCQTLCERNTSCTGLNYIPAGTVRCFLLFRPLGGTVPVDGITHYRIIARCAVTPSQSTTSPATPSVNPCSSQPCLNGATCIAVTSTRFVCECTVGFVGTRCETTSTSTNPCAISPCINGGTCTPTANNQLFTCTCLAGFSGTFCQLGSATTTVTAVPTPTSSTAIPGNDIQGPECTFAVLANANSNSGAFQNDISDAASCFTRCQGDRNCVAADFNRVDTQCFLHTSVTVQNIQLNTCCVRFIRRCTTCNDNEYFETQGINGPIPQVVGQAENVAQCQSQCASQANRACEAFTYGPTTGICQIYNSPDITSNMIFSPSALFNHYQRYRCVNNINQVPYINQ